MRPWCGSVAMLLASAVIATAGPVPRQPVYVQLVTTFDDYVNPELSEERLERTGPLVAELARKWPQWHVSWLVQFNGASAEALRLRQGNGLYDAIRELQGRGLVEIGYDGAEEPTPFARPRPNLRGADTGEARWLARSQALAWFLAEGRDALTGEPGPGVGGLARVVEIFGPPASVWEASLDVGCDPELVHQLRRMGLDALMPGLPMRTHALTRNLHGYRGAAAMLATLVSAHEESAPEVFWMDHTLRLSDYTAQDTGVVVAHGGAKALRDAIDRLDPARPHVVRLRLGHPGLYMKVGQGRRNYLSPLEYAFDNTKEQRLPPDLVLAREDIEAGYAREAEALDWLVTEFFPATPGSRFVSVADLRAMAGGGDGLDVAGADVPALATSLLTQWDVQGPNPPAFLEAGGLDLSLAETFVVLVEALAARSRTDAWPERVRAGPVYGPLDVDEDGAAGRAAVTVGAVVRAATGLAPRLADQRWSAVPPNVIPSIVDIDGERVSASQFLRLMAEAALAGDPAARLTPRDVSMFTAVGEAMPRNRSRQDVGATWTIKPARLRADRLRVPAEPTASRRGTAGTVPGRSHGAREPRCMRPLAGTIRDASGGRVPGARVMVSTGSGGVLAETVSRFDGGFLVCGLPRADVSLTVRHGGFAAWQDVVAVADDGARVVVDLDIQPLREAVTVTAVRGDTRRVRSTPELVSTVERARLDERPGGLLVQRLVDLPGVHVQQTSTSQTSPFVRGLTGQQVVTLIDGVRFNTAAFRPGANQYTALLDGGAAERVEVVHGPGASQYGSDSLGGTINVLTRAPGSWTSHALSGEAQVSGATADRSVGGGLALGWSAAKATAFAQATARAAGDLRAGGGRDSHSVVTRLFGLPSSVLGERLADTAYDQQGVLAKATLRPGRDQVVGATFLRGEQRHASRYDMLDGGAGNLLHRFDPQTADFAVLRYERLALGPIATLGVSASYNHQRDDREYRNINNNRLGLRSDLSTERNAITSRGLQAVASFAPSTGHALRTGVEWYGEEVDATREDRTLDGALKAVRARMPNGARYTSLGAFAQDVVTLGERLQVHGALRYSRFSYTQRAGDNPLGAAGPLVPDFDAAFDDVTGQVGAVVALAPAVSVTVNLARGFRAPNINDFGTIGVSGGGFEIAPDEAVRAGGHVVGPPGSAGTVPVGELGAERMWSYDVGLRLSTRAVSASVAAFQADVDGLVERRNVLLAPGATGSEIGGQIVIRQDASGAIYTAASSSPVFVRVNGTDVRFRGVEGRASGRIGAGVSWMATAAFVRGEVRATGVPPDVENGIPPAHGTTSVRWSSAGGRWWVEAMGLWAAPQERLSSNDLKQARIGGLRTPSEIRDFFNNGAVARGLVVDGRLVATGETLDAVIARVLGSASSSVLYGRHPGYVTFNLGAGWRPNAHAQLTVLVENVLDRNYRTMGSGVDGAGVNLIVRQAVRF